MNKARLVLESPETAAGTLQLAATLTHVNGATDRLWWKLPEAFAPAVTPWSDPFVIALTFPMMQAGTPVHVEGRVSPSLLANLDLFMRIWHVWAPDKYRPVSITAAEELELPPAERPGRTLASFSCGVDSSFTVFRHKRGLAGRRTREIGAAVVQHGFDVWHSQPNSGGVFEEMLVGARTMLHSLDLPCIPLATNFQQLRLNWPDAWGTQLVGGLTLFAGWFDTALVANDLPYAWLGIPWASHPTTTPLLGSRGFDVIDDGGEFTRTEKAAVIADWPEAMHHLHVCFGVDVPGRYENCCRCEKCTRTILAFRIAGRERPSAFKYDVSDKQIRRVRLTVVNKELRWEQLATEAAAAGLGDTGWAKAVRAVLRKTRHRAIRCRFQRPFIPLRNRIRRMTRGTALSRSELARRSTEP